MSSPRVVALRHAAAEAAALAAVLLSEEDEGVKKALEGRVLLVEAEASEFVEDSLVGGEVVAGSCEALQGAEAWIGGIEGADVGRQLIEGGGGAEIALVAIDLLGLAAAPRSGGEAEGGETFLKGRGTTRHRWIRGCRDQAKSGRCRRCWRGSA